MFPRGRFLAEPTQIAMLVRNTNLSHLGKPYRISVLG